MKNTFGAWWASMLWHAMTKTGYGYRIPSLRRTGIGADRRHDKLEASAKGWNKHQRRYYERYFRGDGKKA